MQGFCSMKLLPLMQLEEEPQLFLLFGGFYW